MRMCPARRSRAAGLGKVPTTSVRRLISLFNRSKGFVDQICCQCAEGNAVNESSSSRASSSISATAGWERSSMRTTSPNCAWFEEFATEWGERYPAIVQLWRNSWAEFVPFLEYDVEIRRVICTTNAIESINARYRRPVRARGRLPHEAAAPKCRHFVNRWPGPTC